MDDLRLSYSHWGMHCCYTYPGREQEQSLEKTGDWIYADVAWPMTYCGDFYAGAKYVEYSTTDSYDAKYLHG